MAGDIHIVNWWCDRCLWHGQISFTDDPGVMAVLHLIEDDHAGYSPSCVFDKSSIRVGEVD